MRQKITVTEVLFLIVFLATLGVIIWGLTR